MNDKKSPIGGIITADLDPMYNSVCKFVKAHQGEKGYIPTQNYSLDTIYGFIFDDGECRGVEIEIMGVRVKDGDLEIVWEHSHPGCVITYDENSYEDDAEWWSLRWSDIYYVPTLFNIAEYIEEYVEE